MFGGEYAVRRASHHRAMTEHALVPSVAPELVLVAVAMRVLRDPVLALDVTNETLATSGVSDGLTVAVQLLGRVIAAADRTQRVSAVERRRQGRTDVACLGPRGRMEVTRLASLVLRLPDDVMHAIRGLERNAPPLGRRVNLACSGLVVGIEEHEHHER